MVCEPPDLAISFALLYHACAERNSVCQRSANSPKGAGRGCLRSLRLRPSLTCSTGSPQTLFKARSEFVHYGVGTTR
jgi:hypothetical protein